MMSNDVNSQIAQMKYQLLPPDGGWGYIIMLSMAISIIVTIVPMSAFGIIFGRFLANVGDETSGTALANGIFSTIYNFTGLIANNLLNRYSYRSVSIIGSFIFFLGNISIIFVDNLYGFIITFGIIQGIGFGLILPATFTALNCYFDKKLDLANNVAQALMIIVSIIIPAFGQLLMDEYGYKGCIAILAAISLNSIFASLTLQPVEWHMIKKPIAVSSQKNGGEEQIEPLIIHNHEYIKPKPRASIISMRDHSMSVTTIDRLGKQVTDVSLWKSLNIELLIDPIYLNLTFGLSLSLTADVAFISILPLLYNNVGYDATDITWLLTVFFVADLIARIILSVLSALYPLNNRLLFFGSTLISIIFRILFVVDYSFNWQLSICAILGFLRCFIQTPLPIVIADAYPDNFPTAFSLYMVVCGIVSLLFGWLMSFTKSLTNSDVMVVHLLTLAFIICCLTWTVEFIYLRLKKRK